MLAEFFDHLIPTAAEMPEAKLAARLVQAAILGIVVAAVYYSTQRKIAPKRCHSSQRWCCCAS